MSKNGRVAVLTGRETCLSQIWVNQMCIFIYSYSIIAHHQYEHHDMTQIGFQ
jgi:hypothetical protein